MSLRTATGRIHGTGSLGSLCSRSVVSLCVCVVCGGCVIADCLSVCVSVVGGGCVSDCDCVTDCISVCVVFVFVH